MLSLCNAQMKISWIDICAIQINILLLLLLLLLYFADCYESTNDDGYKHNFFTALRVPLIFHFLLLATDASPLFSCLNIFHFSLFFKNYSMVTWAYDIYYSASLFSFLSSTMMSGLLSSILLSC